MADDNSPSWFERAYNGGVSGWNSFFDPQRGDIPNGALYDADTKRQANMAMLGQLGATLLSAGQGGQSYQQRAATLASLGNASTAYSQTLAQGAQNAVARAQISNAEAAILNARTKAAQAASWQSTLGGLFGGGITPGGAPAMMPTSGSPSGGVLPVSMAVPAPGASNGSPEGRTSNTGARWSFDTLPEAQQSALISLERETGVPRNVGMGLWGNESSMRTTNVPRGDGGRAFGAMQMHSAALADVNRQYGTNYTQDDLEKDHVLALTLGGRYWSQQRQMFGDDRLATLAYNYGPGNVQRWQQDGADWSKLPQERRAYVERVHGPLGGSAAPTASPTAGPAVAAPGAAPSAPPSMAGGQSPQVQGFLASLDPERRRILAATLSRMDPEEGAKFLAQQALSHESYTTLSPADAQRLAGGAYNSRAIYQRNSRTGQVSIQNAPEERVTYRPLTADEARAQNLDPRRGWQVGSDGKVVEVGGGGTNVTVGGDNATLKYSFETLTRERQAVEAQRPAFSQLQQMADLVSGGMRSGNLEALTVNLRGWMSSANLLTPEQSRNLTQQQLFEQASKKLIASSLPPGAASDTDVRNALAANPALDNTPQGIMIKAAVTMQAIRYAEDRVAAMEQFATQRGEDGQTRGIIGFDAEWRRNRPNVIPRINDMSELAQHQPGTVVRLPSGVPEEARRNFPHYPFMIVGG